MKFTANKAVVAVLFAIIITGSIVFNIKINNLKKEKTELYNQIANEDIIVQVDSTLYKRAALQLEKITTENKALKNHLKNSDATIRAKTDLIVKLSDQMKDITTRDSIIIDELSRREIGVRTFFVDRNTFSIGGYFQKQPPWELTFDNIQADIGLRIHLLENKNSSWETFVETDDPNIFVSELNTEIKPYRPRWYEQFHYGIGAHVGGDDLASIYGALGYSKYFVTVGYSTYGATLGILYMK